MDATAASGATPRIAANGIELAYETFGVRTDPPLVLIMGLGGQMVAWPEELCRALADSGHFVVRFDNRDVGESTHLDDAGVPTLRDVLRRRQPPYGIEDMADDTAGLIEALDLDRAHLVGASMGGFIAQTVALRHPARVRTLTLIMTSTGSRKAGRAKPKVFFTVLRRKPAADREAAAAGAVEIARLIGSPGFPVDEVRLSDAARRAFDRGNNPAGVRRQLAAISAQPDRTPDLASIGVPTLVVHGLEDPLVRSTGGVALARAIPGAKFVGYPGMGHDLPAPLWPDLVQEISAVTRRG